MAEYIDREAFKAEVRRLSTNYLNEWETLGILAAADRIPASDVRPVKRGRWIQHYESTSDNEMLEYGWECSICGRWEMDKAPFCNCGAEMEETE